MIKNTAIVNEHNDTPKLPIKINVGIPRGKRITLDKPYIIKNATDNDKNNPTFRNAVW